MIGPGTSLLHYRLVEKIGEGGMGVVWKAVDTTLDRQVAVKILPEAFAGEADRLMRFQREAKLLAALNHPNIATVHGLHRHGEVRFLAMELAAGEDLARRLARGPLPIDEALAIGLQVAEALEAAHESGVIHRDLKPANIQVGPDSRVKVLDFGLAKALEGDSTAGDPSLSPTVTSAGTRAGVILGTAAYMSPEQAKGRPADKRADVWAFGCVLLEMLTGRQTFHGESVAETLAAVIKEPPAWDRLPEDTPRRIRRLLRRCLDKDPRQRLRDIGEARIAIASTLAGEADEPALQRGGTAAPAVRWWRALPWGLTGLLAAALLGTWAQRGSAPAAVAEPAETVRLSMTVPEDQPMFLANLDLEVMPSFSLSPAGDRVVYVARDDPGQTEKGAREPRLHVRDLGGYGTEQVRGTGGAEAPFFSPDGRWIGFFDGSSLAKIPAGGGARVTIAAGIGNGNGASWGPDGTIVFAHSYVGPLWQVPDSGGEPRAVTALAEGERSHRFPRLLPDGTSVLFTIKPAGILSFDAAWIAVADLRTGEHRVLIEGGSYPFYVGSGHLVYAREGGLLAAPFDLDRLEITGGAVPVLDGVVTNSVTGAALVDCARNGTLTYVPGDYRSGPASLLRIDRETGARDVLAPDRFNMRPRLSPDGRRLVLHASAANDQVMTLDLERGTVARMTDAAANNFLPIWSPAGDRILFSTDRGGREEIVSIPADGGLIEVVVAAWGPPLTAYSWSSDGTLLTLNVGVRSSRDIWVLDTRSGGEPAPFLATRFDEGDAVFSPDGRWLAYNSDESGRMEIYARPYPGPGGKIQISTGGGYYPRWRRDGAELYYQEETALMAVPITWADGPRPGRPRAIIEIAATTHLDYDVDPDGRQFYVVELDESHWEARRLDVILNWFPELTRIASKQE